MNLITSFAKFVSRKPVLVFTVSIVLLVLASFGSKMIVNEEMDYTTLMPEDLEVIEASNFYSNNFGSSDGGTLVIQLEPRDVNLSVKSVLDPEVIKYSERLVSYVTLNSENIKSIKTPASIIRLIHNGTIPNSESILANDFSNNLLLKSFVSDDLNVMVLSVSFNDGYSTNDVIDELNSGILAVKKPIGVRTDVGGASLADSVVVNELGEDMARTGKVSMFGIVLILIFTFMSLKYAFLPLFSLIFGVTWTFGYVGWFGIPMNSATSGVLSMIMGIGIDFGIQMINRYRQELVKNKNKKNKIERSMKTTLEKNFYPMFTATLSAVVGFKAMGLGQLTMMKDMGDIMVMGVVFCFFAAITILPSFTIILEQILEQVKIKKGNKVYKVR